MRSSSSRVWCQEKCWAIFMLPLTSLFSHSISPHLISLCCSSKVTWKERSFASSHLLFHFFSFLFYSFIYRIICAAEEGVRQVYQSCRGASLVAWLSWSWTSESSSLKDLSFVSSHFLAFVTCVTQINVNQIIHNIRGYRLLLESGLILWPSKREMGWTLLGNLYSCAAEVCIDEMTFFKMLFIALNPSCFLSFHSLFLSFSFAQLPPMHIAMADTLLDLSLSSEDDASVLVRHLMDADDLPASAVTTDASFTESERVSGVTHTVCWFCSLGRSCLGGLFQILFILFSFFSLSDQEGDEFLFDLLRANREAHCQ